MSDKAISTNRIYALPTERTIGAAKDAGTKDVQTGVRDPRLEEVSKLYEKQFLREMVKAMRSTLSEDGIVPTNMAEKIYRDQLDGEYVEAWGDQGGIGLADLIYEQLDEKILARQKGPAPRQQGTMTLRERDVYKAKHAAPAPPTPPVSHAPDTDPENAPESPPHNSSEDPSAGSMGSF